MLQPLQRGDSRARALNTTKTPTPPYESIFKVIEPGRYSEKVQKRSMESTVLNVHYVIYSTELHVTLMRPDQ